MFDESKFANWLYDLSKAIESTGFGSIASFFLNANGKYWELEVLCNCKDKKLLRDFLFINSILFKKSVKITIKDEQ